MKKWLFAICAVMMFPAAAQQFEEGKHYEVIAEEATAEPEIREFFSFYCVHCYRFEPIAQLMKKEYEDSFDKAHVSFIDPQGMGTTMSRAYAAAKVLKKEQEVASAVFRTNFDQDRMLLSKNAIRDIFVANGVSGEEFDKAMASFSVRGMANKFDRDATKYRINATPTFIVNGRYKLLPQGFQDSKDFATDFVAAAGYLMKKD